ncbi:efflux RND transporter permease subunit, partial [Escherichia coli]|uniref:efflux RND transporter permease subunit n=1 Tax=Escherichia coli TaxID=562 RepID=UPI00201B035E
AQADGPYRESVEDIANLRTRNNQGEMVPIGSMVTDLFGTLQTYLGSSYVNDFNQFGRTWRVMAQADGPYRESVEDIANLRTRNNQGEMVPIGSMV